MCFFSVENNTEPIVEEIIYRETGFSIFLSFLYNLLSQRQSFFPPSSSLLFVWEQVVQSKQMFCLHLCSQST